MQRRKDFFFASSRLCGEKMSLLIDIILLLAVSWLLFDRLRSQKAPRSRALVQVNSGQIAESAITLDHLDSSITDRLNRSPSSATAIVAGTAISITKPVMRIYGSGGPVIMTAAPNLTTGSYDGQIVSLQGTDDTNTITVRDASNLANSGLHLEHGRDFTLGKNDILELMWDNSQSLWVELRRIDNY